MFDSAPSDMVSDLEPCVICGGVGFGGCVCDEKTMELMEEQNG